MIGDRNNTLGEPNPTSFILHSQDDGVVSCSVGLTNRSGGGPLNENVQNSTDNAYIINTRQSLGGINLAVNNSVRLQMDNGNGNQSRFIMRENDEFRRMILTSGTREMVMQDNENRTFLRQKSTTNISNNEIKLLEGGGKLSISGDPNTQGGILTVGGDLHLVGRTNASYPTNDYPQKRQYITFQDIADTDSARIYSEGSINNGTLVLALQDDVDNTESFVIRGEKNTTNVNEAYDIARFFSKDRIHLHPGGDGRVSINNNAPSEALDVSGNIKGDNVYVDGHPNDDEYDTTEIKITGKGKARLILDGDNASDNQRGSHIEINQRQGNTQLLMGTIQENDVLADGEPKDILSSNLPTLNTVSNSCVIEARNKIGPGFMADLQIITSGLLRATFDKLNSKNVFKLIDRTLNIGHETDENKGEYLITSSIGNRNIIRALLKNSVADERLILLQSGGRIGVGKASGINRTLDINGDFATNQVDIYNAGTGNNESRIDFKMSNKILRHIYRASDDNYIIFDGPNERAVTRYVLPTGTANDSRLRLLESGGRVGINLTTSQTIDEALHVNGNILSSQNVQCDTLGVGIAPNQTKLHIGGNTTLGASLRLQNTGTGGGQGFIAATNNTWNIGGSRVVIGYGGVASANADITIDSNRNVGIGTTNPTEKLDVNGVVKCTNLNAEYTTTSSAFTSNEIESRLNMFCSPNPLTPNVPGQTRFFMRRDDVSNSFHYFGLFDAVHNHTLHRYRISSSGNNLRYSIFPNTAGRVGIGISNENVSFQLHLSTDSGAKPSTNTWTVPSDKRIKEDIVIADYDRCYEIVDNLDLKYYKWTNEFIEATQCKDIRQLGWIADEVQEVFPKAVTINEGTTYGVDNLKCFNADSIYKVMYGCVKKLQEKVKHLEDEVEELKNVITTSQTNKVVVDITASPDEKSYKSVDIDFNKIKSVKILSKSDNKIFMNCSDINITRAVLGKTIINYYNSTDKTKHYSITFKI